MAKQNLNIGSSANDGTGDTLRAAGSKINDTLVEIYLKGMIASINLSLVIWVNLKKSSKFDENLDKKRFFG